MTRVAPHLFKSTGVTQRCIAIVGGEVCNEYANFDGHLWEDPVNAHADVQLSRDDVVTQAIEAAKQAQAFADRMSADSTASPRMLAEVWSTVSQAWSTCAMVMEDRVVVDAIPDEIRLTGPHGGIEDLDYCAPRIIAWLMARMMGLDNTLVINQGDWDRLAGVGITVTVAGDGSRIVRRAS